ncbi:RidA family protein [Micromonospora olivasterospora]|uniref:Enamine deaminase RidA (YjgF/YER057c/UK114 family) n=1 Tax=Micromonospora olivasterospora TaxID=1880 RepID=A0A562IJ70_MICOL|nr:RidA family protein [Micromonospora olivasterospora]TWH70733.1 enamine deaminase RidA (YjgF/YER057c/UK114 family) [Micromonospora olivasterospora]
MTRSAIQPLPLPHGTRAGDYAFISGQVAVRPAGSTVIGDFGAAARAVLDNVRAFCHAAGGDLSDVCKVTAFLLNATLFEPFNAVYSEYFADPLPARSTVLAPLSNPDLRIETEAGDRGWAA